LALYVELRTILHRRGMQSMFTNYEAGGEMISLKHKLSDAPLCGGDRVKIKINQGGSSVIFRLQKPPARSGRKPPAKSSCHSTHLHSSSVHRTRGTTISPGAPSTPLLTLGLRWLKWKPLHGELSGFLRFRAMHTKKKKKNQSR